jgi:hypothetical protein
MWDFDQADDRLGCAPPCHGARHKQTHVSRLKARALAATAHHLQDALTRPLSSASRSSKREPHLKAKFPWSAPKRCPRVRCLSAVQFSAEACLRQQLLQPPAARMEVPRRPVSPLGLTPAKATIASPARRTTARQCVTCVRVEPRLRRMFCDCSQHCQLHQTACLYLHSLATRNLP